MLHTPLSRAAVRLLRHTPCIVLVLCLSFLCIPQRMSAQEVPRLGLTGDASRPAAARNAAGDAAPLGPLADAAQDATPEDLPDAAGSGPVQEVPRPALPQAGTVDFFMGAELNYRDILFNGRVYDILVNLTPGVKWHMGRRWEMAAQAYVPVFNQYGDRYSRVRLNMAVLSRQLAVGRRWKMKVSGGLFARERYGIDVKNMFIVSPWLAVTAQAGLTGYCSMAAGWEASRMGRLTALAGPEIWLHRWNAQLSVRGGRYVYGDWGVTGEGFRHFRHVSVGVYAAYSERGGEDAGFKVVVMLPPYRRAQRRVNFRTASNFRLTYSVEAEAYACRTYFTDPEQNERTGWFDRDLLPWGQDTMPPDYVVKDI